MNYPNKKIVSIVIPLYYGKKYIDTLYSLCTEALEKAGILKKSEIIFVNDSPDQPITIDKGNYADNIRIVVNKQNEGIHASKINGMFHAEGEYIHFLDQDDIIEPDFYKSQLEIIENADIVIANAIMKHAKYDRKVYRTNFSLKMVLIPSAYIYMDNRVASLGQCLIRKNAIPQEWFSDVIKINGADDYYLLLSMFEKKRKFKINPKVLYRHVYTESNLSLDTHNMNKSVINVAKLMKKNFPESKTSKILLKKVEYLKGQRNIRTIPFSVITWTRNFSRIIRG